MGINPSYWSIAVEVQLYAIYPLLIALATRFGWQRSLIGLAAIEIALRLTDGVLFTVHGTGLPQWLSGSPLFFWFSWSLGAYLAERHIRGNIFSVPRIFLFAVGTAAVAACFFKPLASLSFLLFALFTTGILATFLRPSAPPLAFPAALRNHLQKVGNWSYSLYLLHQPFVLAVPRLTAKIIPGVHFPPSMMFVFCMMLWIFIVPLAQLFYKFCELPSLAFGKHFPASNALNILINGTRLPRS